MKMLHDSSKNVDRGTYSLIIVCFHLIIENLG